MNSQEIIMTRDKQPFVTLMAEDDADDRLLADEAMCESQVSNQLYFVEDGVQLLQYLRGENDYQDRTRFPYPDLVLLDLNMPKKDGREALAEIKADPRLRRLPVVIITTSKAPEDMLSGYDLGAASYITKPPTFDALVDTMRTLGKYWVDVVEFP